MSLNAEQVFDVLIKMKADGIDLSAVDVFGIAHTYDAEGRCEEVEFWPDTVEDVEGCLTFE